MVKSKIIAILLISIVKINGQNNPIFQGGIADGVDKTNFAQLGNNIVTGGAGNGNANANFTQAGNSIFTGNTGDGSSNIVFLQAANNIFSGGSDDGWHSTNFVQAGNNIFGGGNADGWSGTNFVQAGNAIFAGGVDDGWNVTNFVQAGNSIFAGGNGDGWNAMYYKPLVALPVVYIYFKVKKIDNIAEIDWQTNSETNAANYEIQRGTDALQFITIGKINAKGNSKEVNNYKYLDENPSKSINYYRIKQVDLDGKYTYTPARALNFSDLNSATVKYFPNPTQGHLNIEIAETLQNEIKIINIFNELGIVVGHQKIGEIGENNLKIDMTGLPKGIYFIQIISKNLNSSQKIMLN